MPTSRTFALLAALATCGSFTVAQPSKKDPTPAKSPPLAGPLTELGARLDQALADDDGPAAERLLFEGWDKDAKWGDDRARALLNSKRPADRVLGVAALARRAPIGDLAKLASSLRASEYPDERRALIRAIGTRFVKPTKDSPDSKSWQAPDAQQADQALKLLEPFARGEHDARVKAAAIASLADVGKPAAVAFWIDKLASPPATVGGDRVDDADVVSRAMYGATFALSGVRARKAADVRDWWNATKGAERAKIIDEPADAPKPETWNGTTYYKSFSFDVFFRIAGVKGLPTDEALAWDKLATALEKARDASRERLRPIFGPIHLAHPRLYIADKQQFSALSTMSAGSFQGVTKGNEIILQLNARPIMASTLVHEYVHYVHDSWFPKIPRWLAEGLATSIADPRPAEQRRRPPAPNTELRKMYDAGVFSQMLNWNSGGSTDSKESARYQLAKKAIDFLRFGPFSVPDDRLAFFLGRVNRGENGARAAENVYGLNAKQLDAKAKAWFESGPAPKDADEDP